MIERTQTKITFNKENKIVIKTLKRYLKNINLSAGNIQYLDIFQISIDSSLLTSMIDFSFPLTDTNKEIFVRNTIHRMKKDGKESLDNFGEILEIEAEKYYQSEFKKWYCLLPLNINKQSLLGKRWFSIGDKRLFTRKWNYIFRNFKIDDWFKEIKLNNRIEKEFILQNFIPLEVCIYERDHQSAFRQAESSFITLCSVLNLPLVFNRSRISFGGITRPLNKINPPPVYGVFNDAFEYVATYVETLPINDYKIIDIPKDRIRKAQIFISTLEKHTNNSPIKELVKRTIGIHFRAFDKTTWESAFLLLWQACELITRNPQLDNREVSRRLKILLSKNQDFFSDYIDLTRVVRNEFVHGGIFPENEESIVHMLKMIVEQSILELFLISKKIKTLDRLDLFYQTGSYNRKKIISYLRTLEYIKSRL